MNFSLGFFVGGQVLAGILGSTVTFGNPQPVPRPFLEARAEAPRMYDMMPDGRFLSLAPSAEAPVSKQEFNVVLNWFEELKARAPRQPR